MRTEADEREALRLFADLLDYPRPALAALARRCQGLIDVDGAGDHLAAFHDFLATTPIEGQEEIYTGYFDLNPVCQPYVGYHLFGESYQRSAFLVGLKLQFEAAGFHLDRGEMPDRISVLLRFLAMSEEGEVNEELINEGLLPALARMLADDGPQREPLFKDQVQLEGHSQGEVLGEGFVLAMSDPAVAARGRVDRRQHPYGRGLQALQAVLRSLRHISRCLSRAAEGGHLGA